MHPTGLKQRKRSKCWHLERAELQEGVPGDQQLPPEQLLDPGKLGKKQAEALLQENCDLLKQNESETTGRRPPPHFHLPNLVQVEVIGKS